ncbi:MAG: YrzE family protein [Nocardioides sp.]
MFSRKSSTEQSSADPVVPDGTVRQDGRYDGVRNDGTTAGTATGATGAHARPVEPAAGHRDGTVAPAGATRTDPDLDERTTSEPVHDERTTTAPETAHEKYGGVNTGAAFFGWLVAVAITILLSGIIGAVAAAVSDQADVTQNDAERAANTIGLVAAIVLVAVLALAYYTGGYVAGRMSRFDGARQGLAVWVIGLIVTLVAVAVGWVFGDQYNVLDRVDLPRIPIPTDQVSSGGIITGLVVVVVTALAAMAGGTVGRRYHAKVDRHLAA